VVRGGVEPPTFRFSEVPSPLRPGSRRHRDNPAHWHRCWSMGLHRHHNNRAAVCHVVPFRLWASGGKPSEAGTCGSSVGLGKARTGTAVAPGRAARASIVHRLACVAADLGRNRLSGADSRASSFIRGEVADHGDVVFANRSTPGDKRGSVPSPHRR
jgi:hypothetical protein